MESQPKEHPIGWFLTWPDDYIWMKKPEKITGSGPGKGFPGAF